MVLATELAVDTSANALEMADEMFGPGVTIVSATYTGDARSSGVYSGGQKTSPGAVPADNGVILSTGDSTNFTNSTGSANQTGNSSYDSSGPNGDPGLTEIAGVNTYDAAILEAEFIPTGDVLTMQLVFSSEEYLEWVNSGYNDAVGIWVNGEKAELAIGDGDISIDNINTQTNSNLFIDNSGSGVNTEMDGLTIVVTVKANVNPNEINTIRIGIADAGDAVYDSNLLIVGDSVQTQLIANDDVLNVTAKGHSEFDLLANDQSGQHEETRITHINSEAVEIGDSIKLPTGETLTLTDSGSIKVEATPLTGSTVFTYKIANSNGTSDTAYATLNTSPVDGTEGNDQLNSGYIDAEGNRIDGADGAAEVIFGYGGNDKITAGLGNDDIYGGSGNDFIRAGAGNDLIDGGSGADVLDGGTGADKMVGGSGNDIYYADNAGDTVLEYSGEGTDKVISTISYVLSDNVENLWLKNGTAALDGTGNTGANMIIGNNGSNIIQGLGGNDRLLGLDGDDSISGGNGRDAIDGGEGNDKLSGGADNDKLNGGAGDDLLQGGSGADLMRGKSGTDILEGGAGNDFLDGGSGNDVMTGGLGNDIYFVDSAQDILTELAGEGVDRVISSVSITLEDNFENLSLKGGALDGTGNAANNTIFGTNADNILSGLAGQDRLSSFGGNDILLGGAGNDALDGGAGDDLLEGGSGDDKLKAGTGNDVIIGGTGNDTLYGQGGADQFLFGIGDGFDIIGDFELASDSLVFSGLSVDDLSISNYGTGVTIDYFGGDRIYLAGTGEISLADLYLDFI